MLAHLLTLSRQHSLLHPTTSIPPPRPSPHSHFPAPLYHTAQISSVVASTMGRGKSWESTENEVLARAWIAASEDPITGINQTSKRFMEAIRRRFVEKGTSNPSDGRYGNRSAASCKAHFDNISAEAQKFYVSLRRVRA